MTIARTIYDLTGKLNARLNTSLTTDTVASLRRAAMTLHRWYEHECNGAIQRNEDTGTPYWHSTTTGNRLSKASDRERGAEKTIAAFCKQNGLHFYLQTDPRGGTLCE